MTEIATTRPVRLTLPVQWGDADALGHVNNTVYFRWFESARIRYMEALERPVAAGAAVGPILAATSCNFVRPLFYPCDVEVAIGAARLGGKSFTLDIEVGSAGAVAARGDAVMVWYDYRAEQTIPIDDALRAAILALEGQAA